MQDYSHELRQIEALLDFYEASGIDTVLGETPVDWYARSLVQPAAPRHSAAQGQLGPGVPGPAPAVAPTADTASPRRLAPAVPAPVVPDKAVVASAREAAASAGSLQELRACLEAFDGCNLKQTAKTLVFADGNPKARLMIVGEAPGRDEDQQGLPFVGRSGQLLNRMLMSIGFDRSSAYIANVVPWRPPGNRTPTPQETEICKPFISRQIELVAPDVLVFLGAASAKTLMGVQDGIRKMRGRWMTYPIRSKEIAVMATYHPAYLLRSPLEKRLVWRDFLSVRNKLSGK